MILQYIKKLISFSPRQGKNEVKTYKYIKSVLQKNNVNFVDQVCPTAIPVILQASLAADGEEIESRGVGIKSGSWKGKENIISSLLAFDDIYNIVNNINFNPFCEQTVSTPNYHKGPALAINKNDLPKLLKARQVTAKLKVKKYQFNSHNLLIGNLKNPKNIVFTHYDSLEKGTVDNASGTAILMDIVITSRHLFTENLFVIAGNEELSYEFPDYWGKGYRWFEKKYGKLMDQARKLLVIDSVGHSKAEVSHNPELAYLAIPLKNSQRYSKKLIVIAGDIHQLMEFYHADADDMSKVKLVNLLDAKDKLLKEINS